MIAAHGAGAALLERCIVTHNLQGSAAKWRSTGSLLVTDASKAEVRRARIVAPARALCSVIFAFICLFCVRRHALIVLA